MKILKSKYELFVKNLEGLHLKAHANASYAIHFKFLQYVQRNVINCCKTMNPLNSIEHVVNQGSATPGTRANHGMRGDFIRHTLREHFSKTRFKVLKY